ncbi:hypothetical protein AVEN_15745-1 [Araneus ventricosus]|uniref:Uncharacterized protein n=1 Tax=Araneus ventricosus TaxID=182803 RepID=A0A4Y2R1T4_ARAVE|nr:hypothetical protein AVEN_15745-1 [Araneus ventricosus]
MSSLETLSNFHNRIHPVAVEILALLNILQNRDFDVLFCWIPGHVGIVGNNLADNAAKTASSFLQREIPCCDAKKSFARRLQSLWQESWDRQTNNKLHILRPTISSWPCMPVRELDVKVTRLRIGHTRFTHRHLLFGERAPTCSRCQYGQLHGSCAKKPNTTNHPHPEIFLGDTPIPVVSEAKFLGINFDDKLTFKPHILNLKQKCVKTLNLLKILSNTSWGADFQSLLKIYKSLILSKLDYGCMIYGSASKSVLQILDPVHHLGLRLASRAFRTSPVHSLYVICGVPCLQFRRQTLSLKYYFRIKGDSEHPMYDRVLHPLFGTLYSNKKSYTPSFGHRMRFLIQDLDMENVDILAKEEETPPWTERNIDLFL